MRVNIEMRDMLLKELSDCSDGEMKIILSVVKNLRYALKDEVDSV